MIRFALNRKKNKTATKQQGKQQTKKERLNRFVIARFDVFNEDYGKEVDSKKVLSSIHEEEKKVKSVHTAGGLERQLLTRNASNNQVRERERKQRWE